MRIQPGANEKGWTVIELVSVMAIIAILGFFMADNLDFGMSSARSDMTMQRMEGLKAGILGADYAMSDQGTRKNFGFIGDIGRLPANLGELTTQGALPTWAYSTAYGVGVGWRGPYVSGPDSYSKSTLKDGWGNAFVYSTTSPGAYLLSYGMDGVAGGVSMNTDLTVDIPFTQWRGQLSGNVRDGNGAVSGAIIDLRYPVDGVLTSRLTTADASGYFQFTTIPFGMRSLQVTSPNSLGPRPVVVQLPETSIPDGTLNFRGGTEDVTYTAGSAKNYTSGTAIVAHFRSTYSVMLQLASVTVSWAGGGTYSAIVVNGIRQDISPAVGTATSVTINPTMVVPANSSDNSLELAFSTTKVGVALTVVFTWYSRTATDSITFTP